MASPSSQGEQRTGSAPGDGEGESEEQDADSSDGEELDVSCQLPPSLPLSAVSTTGGPVVMECEGGGYQVDPSTISSSPIRSVVVNIHDPPPSLPPSAGRSGGSLSWTRKREPATTTSSPAEGAGVVGGRGVARGHQGSTPGGGVVWGGRDEENVNSSEGSSGAEGERPVSISEAIGHVIR